MSRFEKYRPESEFAPLLKLEQGESFRGVLIGAREIEGKYGVAPILDLRDFRGQERGWIASTWSAREELVYADPQDGDVVG